MAGKDLKAFKAVWAATCKTMWVQVAALRHLEGFLRGNYASIPAEAVVTDLTFAPECKGRLDDATKDFLLQRVAYFIHCEVTLRVVLLSAAFESFFDVFLESYILHRPKFFAAGTRTKEGDKVYGETKRASGLAERVEAFATWTGAKIAEIKPLLPALRDTYLLRNVIAHDAGICDAYTAGELTIIKAVAGTSVCISPDELVSSLAPPCIKIAEALDEKIVPK